MRVRVDRDTDRLGPSGTPQLARRPEASVVEVDVQITGPLLLADVECDRPRIRRSHTGVLGVPSQPEHAVGLSLRYEVDHVTGRAEEPILVASGQLLAGLVTDPQHDVAGVAPGGRAAGAVLDGHLPARPVTENPDVGMSPTDLDRICGPQAGARPQRHRNDGAECAQHHQGSEGHSPRDSANHLCPFPQRSLAAALHDAGAPAVAGAPDRISPSWWCRCRRASLRQSRSPCERRRGAAPRE